MNESRYRKTSIAALERSDGWSPIRAALDVQSFGVNAWTGHEAGAVVIPEHDEEPSGHEELYVVVAGHATITVDGEKIDGPAGTIVFVSDPAAKRGAVARDPQTTILTAGAKPGEAYRPRSWELNRDVIPLFDSGNYEEAKRLLLDTLDRYNDQAGLLYNLACAEARLGETDEALEHLREAVAASPSFADLARDDADFESVREDARFATAIAT